MSDLTRTDRQAIFSRVITTVETKHFDPNFPQDRWRTEAQEARASVLETSTTSEFESALSNLVRAFGTPDSGFFHESQRHKVPKGLAARFQYCRPNECSPAATQASPAGDVMISRLSDGVGWMKVTKFPGAVGVDIAKQIDHGIKELHGCGRLIIDLRGNAGGGPRIPPGDELSHAGTSSGRVQRHSHPRSIGLFKRRSDSL